MTPSSKAKELAEKIWSVVGSWNIETLSDNAARLQIESLLSQALEEAEEHYRAAYKARIAHYRGMCYSKAAIEDLKQARADEREQCAKIAERYNEIYPTLGNVYGKAAEAIRLRSEGTV